MPIRKLKKFLDENEIKYAVINHSTAYRVQDIAHAAHVSGKEIAKTVIVKIEGRMTMVVLPASYTIDFDLLKGATGAERAELATEEEFKNMFPDCELGAMPPFGNLYCMDVYVDRSLTEDEEIFFNAGNHRELIKIKFKDFDTLVQPKMFDITFVHSGI